MSALSYEQAQALSALSFRIRCRRRVLEDWNVDVDMQLWLFEAEVLLDEEFYSRQEEFHALQSGAVSQLH